VRFSVSASWVPLLLSLSSNCARAETLISATPASARSRQAEDSLIELPVGGHEPAVVSVPRATTPQPLVVAAHGAWDRPEPHCRLWRRVIGDRGFILCPRGQPTNRHVPASSAAYYYRDHFALGREVVAAIQALAARYPDRVDPRAAVWAGFSQGAIQGALVIVLYPEMFARAVLVEGGNGFFNEWSPFAARKYARGGGERVLFGCGSVYCVRAADRCAGYLEHAGVEARIAHAQGAGHSYGPAMEARLSEHFAWVVAGDPRW
jgi:predicted esterase